VAERDSYKPGTFSWSELLTTDREAAKRFYEELFGWKAEDNPVGDAGVYTMFGKDGRHVAATYQPPAERGIPPNWGSYVTVESAEAATERVRELGGTVLADPFDVMDAGRMAVFNDPQGAGFMAWEPRDHIGAQVVNEPGALTLNQLNTNDPEAAGRFYTDLFGWEVRSVGEGYWGIFNDGALNGGMMPIPEGSPAPPHWLTYFGSEDIDASVARVGELGGQVMIAPMEVPGGRVAVVQDPQGAFFALFEGRFDD
jgi:predicted enzyme related to lactoylglutathione lyase